ncbi:O-antigen ligase family protein [Methylobacillus flagellatus]|uniref:O-antigen polymerase n=1 Tax=Methylobacillus flagellatus (strain ATCC 51484 / DSM 6875 / VKM B-1610 / KT) TaxID=265072 RepID=Q1GZQ2_METFK|nr:O-antigen ligase family protein [Methylobacillus flagellatus]ABE50285.1 O-antigen polymerase [Methylobacillus flagellatus KT]
MKNNSSLLSFNRRDANFVSLKIGSIFFVIMAAIVALIFGFVSAIFPWWWIVAIILSILFIFIGFTYPLVALIAVIAISSRLIPDTFLPSIRLLGGTIPSSDMALFATFIFCFFKYNSEFSFTKQALSPLAIPLFVVLLLLLFSVFRAVFEIRLPLKDILGESRHFLYWLLIPLIALTCSDRQRFKFIVFGFLFVAFLFSIGQILQGFLGVNVFGRELTSLETLGSINSDVTRSMTSGTHIIVWGFLFVLALFANRIGFSKTLIILCIFTGAGIFLTYGRAVWGGTFLAVLFLCWKLGTKKMLRSVGLIAIVAVFGLSAMLAIKPGAIEGAMQRLFSVEEEVSHGSSLGWRFYENKMAWAAIQRSPLLGIGLGAPYRPPAKSDVTAEQVRYVHSAYIYLTLKTGIIVFMSVIFLIFKILHLTYIQTRSNDLFISSVAIASFAAMIEYFLACITQPELMQTPGIAFLATLAGLMCAANYLNQKNLTKGKLTS